MKFALIGGDERMVRLCRLLKNDGNGVLPLALDGALGPSPAGAGLSEADCIVFGLPCMKNGAVFAPFFPESLSPGQALAGARPGTPVLAGQAAALTPICERLSLPLCDYFLREELVVKNAALTAEGAVSLLLGRTGGSISGTRVLLCGFGRIGRLLALRLRALGAEVTAAARSPADRAWAQAIFVGAVSLDRADPSDFDIVINTIPAPVLGESFIEKAGSALLVELASPPYGFDTECAARLGRELLLASALPGKIAPEAAAMAIRDTIYGILEE